MTKHVFPMNTEHLLGSVGLFLLIVVDKLADRGDGPQQTFVGRAFRWLARRAVDAIAVVGWFVDRLPEPAVLPSHFQPAMRATGGVRTCSRKEARSSWPAPASSSRSNARSRADSIANVHVSLQQTPVSKGACL
jgi:hypothetical protein